MFLYATLAITPCTKMYLKPLSCGVTQSDVLVHSAPRPLCSKATSKTSVGVGLVLYKFKFTRLFRETSFLWLKLFVAISVQWQGLKRVVTSPVALHFNFSALLDKVAI